METRNGELARVQRELRKTTEGVSECEGRRGHAIEVKLMVHLAGKRRARAYNIKICKNW